MRALTVVVLAGPLRHRAVHVLEALAGQAARDSLEVVVVDAAPQAARLALPGALAARVMPAPGLTYGELRLVGLRTATTPLVAYLEDHCYPDPGWAAAVIDAFDGPWAAVGYAFRNANPQTWASRATAVAEYGQWMAPVRSGPRRLLAGNNVAYRRAAIEPFGERLADLLDVDFNLQRELLTRGEQLYVAGDAVTAHEHFPRLRDAMRASAFYCALLAQRRSQGWSAPRRLLYGVLVPVVAPVRRVQGLLAAVPQRPGLAGLMLRAAPAIAALFVTAALGEARGYLRPGAELPRGFTRAELEMRRAIEVPT